MCVHAMKEFGINKVYYSNENGQIESIKVSEMVPEHISHGTILTMKKMTKQNQYLIFGMAIDFDNINRKDKTLILYNG